MRKGLLLALVGLMLLLIPPEAYARQWTITQRQEEQRKIINASERANELTRKEADSLRHSLDKIAASETKMKSNNGGKLSYKDQAKLEKSLNGVSLKIQKYKLAKRVVKPR